MSLLLNARDIVVAPFARSRAPKDLNQPGSPGRPAKDATPSSGKGTTSTGQASKRSANAEGTRTTVNPHTPRTDLAAPQEEGLHIGVTGVEDILSAPTGSEVKSPDGEGTNNPDATGGTTSLGATSVVKSVETETVNGNRTYVLGVSTRGGGDGKIIVDERGRVVAAEAWSPTAGDSTTATGDKDNQEGKGLSRLWSRTSRTSADGKRRGSVGEAGGKSPTSTRRMTSPTRTRSKEEPSRGPGSNSTPASPSSSRFKVPLKDKIKGEMKIITGKMSKNEAQVEQGVALKTGASPTRPTH
ncbi:hypothetical protein BDV93DRAFT_522480 [Ceratobasidium sp. AG-I]|nr:hypothetical protein BDV93DRAFT_522480 [Ceratobasidium sp. AG-I]